MKPIRPKSNLLRRALAAFMAFLVGFGPITPLAWAADTPLADGPIAVNIKAKPNIVFTLDDSTSMNLNFLPDYLVVDSLTNAATTWCRSTTGLQACGSTGSASVPQYHFAEWLDAVRPPSTSILVADMPVANRPRGAGVTFPWPASYGNTPYGPPAVMTSAFNALFYNPAVTYTAPLKYDGSSYPNQNAANTSGFTRVQVDPYLFPTKYVNLTLKVSVGVWCNTSYAGTFTSHNAVPDRDGIAIGGDHCRINGMTYAAGANGAPATKGDYSYPFAKRGTADPAGPENFFATTDKRLHCDPSKLNTTPAAPVAGTPPSCVACAPTCPVAQVKLPDNPVGCDMTCTNPAECLVCNVGCPVALTVPTSCGTKTCGAPHYANLTCGDGFRCTYTPPNPTPPPTIDAVNCNTVIKQKCSDGSAPVGAVCTTGLPLIPAATVGKTYEQDANGAGDVCRRNNFNYADGFAGGWKYPTAPFTTQSNSCGTIWAAINRHYYRAAVQWCDAQIPLVNTLPNANKKWRGYGTGNCQAEKTTTYKWPRFVKAGSDLSSTVPNELYDDAAFELVQLDYVNGKIIVRNNAPADSIDHTLENGDTLTRAATGDTPEASELVNYANWFAYYRTRMLAAKSVTSLAFSELTDKFRVGFHTLSNVPATDFLTVNDFSGGAGNQRDKWFGRLQNVKVPMGNDTPLLDGVVRIGEWFKSSTGTHPELSGSTDPINLSCQKNYHIMFTDGYTNQPTKPPFLVGNRDGVNIPDWPNGEELMPEEILELPRNTAWPKRFKEGPTAIDDSLSDYTLYYWMRDLRPPSFPDLVAENNVTPSENDPAKWQHLNFAGLSLGTEGVLPSLDPKSTEDKITAGTLTWTTPAPSVIKPGVTGVDDLWHAAITGRSQFVNARDPAALQTGMAAILNEIKNQQAARAGVAFSSVNFAKEKNYIYRVTIEPGWGGTLTKVLVDEKGGGELAIETKYHDVLAAQVTPSFGVPEPWFTDRNVITWSPAAKKAMPFRWDDLEAGQRSTLGPTEALQKKVIAYLRGDRSNEGVSLKNFRIRSQVLGDIVNSSPVLVGEPAGQYSDSTDPGYEAFKAAQASRAKMVYVGANDGMLHAFDEATGKEKWAYIPSFVYSSEPDKGLAMLAKKDPFFKHQMFVDATPVVADVDIGGTWRTVLVGGVGKGGKGVYAIDVTAPSGVSDESDAAANVLWEFTDSELGYTYGRPLIAKTYKDGWVAIIPSGHNSGGKGKLFFVSLADGTLLRTMETGAGSAGSPSGLAQVSGFVLSYKNQLLEQIYGGDLMGNVWRFDVSNADPSAWTVTKFAELTSTDGTAQSVTTAPQIEVDFANGVDRYVMVGTGRLLHEDDLVTYAEQVQTMYVIRDGSALKPNTAGLPHKPRTDADFSKLTDFINGFSKLSVKGWYHDLPKGERIVSPIAAELNYVGYAGSLPPENECLPGLAANIYVRDFPFAASQLVDDVTGDVTSAYYSEQGAVGMEFVNIYSESVNDPTLKLAITLGSDGKTIYIDLAKNTVTGDHRMSWRLLGR